MTIYINLYDGLQQPNKCKNKPFLIVRNIGKKYYEIIGSIRNIQCNSFIECRNIQCNLFIECRNI
jgi:hypothetical protein